MVADYRNKASNYDAEDWVKQSVLDADSIIGLYDVHSYPGQNEVRSGKYPEILTRYKQHLPKGKKIVLGEAGYKYWRKTDSLLMAEYNRRVEGHPFTKRKRLQYALLRLLLWAGHALTCYGGYEQWIFGHGCMDAGRRHAQ
mgnify:CR=1 FL=1